MPRTKTAASRRRARVVSLNDRLRACRRCHLAGYLDECDSVPIARDPDPDSSVPRILLVGQAPGLARRSRTVRSRGSPATSSGPGLNKEASRARSSTRGSTSPRSPDATPAGLPARGDRLPSPEEQALCRPWLDELIQVLEPEIVLLVGSLAIRT